MWSNKCGKMAYLYRATISSVCFPLCSIIKIKCIAITDVGKYHIYVALKFQHVSVYRSLIFTFRACIYTGTVNVLVLIVYKF